MYISFCRFVSIVKVKIVSIVPCCVSSDRHYSGLRHDVRDSTLRQIRHFFFLIRVAVLIKQAHFDLFRAWISCRGHRSSRFSCVNLRTTPCQHCLQIHLKVITPATFRRLFLLGLNHWIGNFCGHFLINFWLFLALRIEGRLELFYWLGGLFFLIFFLGIRRIRLFLQPRGSV